MDEEKTFNDLTPVFCDIFHQNVSNKFFNMKGN